MEGLLTLIIGFLSLFLGSILGYYTRQSIARKKLGTIEEKLSQKVSQAKLEAEKILEQTKEKANEILASTKKELEEKKAELLKKDRFLLKKENLLEKRSFDLAKREEEFELKIKKFKEIKETLKKQEKEVLEKLEKISGLSLEEAKKELMTEAEKDCQKEMMERLRKLEKEGEERFEQRAREILANVIQRLSISQTQEITATIFHLPSDEIKGKIIGKEGRNIRILEKLTGVEIVIDETPEMLIISGYDPIRRQIAKIALERLIKDGRIQPARIEEEVERAKNEISKEIKEAGETAVFELGIIGLDPKLVQLLGRLKFRTSYGQNVLLHSIEVAYLASALAQEIGANPLIAKKAGLLHDIGKSVDQQVEGSHVDIGIKILEKFGVEKEVIEAIKSHHGQYPVKSIEAVLVQTADQISGARPGARKDTLENYLKRLEQLEAIASSFPGVEKAWALQAGREIRVFVRPEEIDDFAAQKLAREIAKQIQEELKYPGEIKVNVIREMRIVEYAR